MVFCLYFSCKPHKFIRASKVCNIETNHKKIDYIQIFNFLHDQEFLDKQVCCQICELALMKQLATEVKYSIHPDCGYLGCSYESTFINDSLAYIFRFDLRKLMSLYNFKDSNIYLNKYYRKFENYDKLKIKEYCLTRNKDTLTLNNLGITD
jgi:hypothetical protein